MHEQKRRRSLWQRMLLLPLVVIALLVATPGVGQAVVADGNRTMYYTGGNAYAGWRNVDDYGNWSATPQTIAANQCVITAFDWKRTAGHYDARVARSCQNGGFRSSGDHWELAGYGLSGMQKLGNCVGSLGSETSGACWNQADGELHVNTVSIATYCSKKWTKFSNGVNFFESGGAVTSCSS